MPFKEFDGFPRKRSPGRPLQHPVVVIDDDSSVRDGLALLLGERYAVTLCANAEEGVQAVHEDVCAVILDVKMPGLDGFWACTEIRKRSPTVPVIFYSAFQDAKNPFAIINDHRPFGYVCKGDDNQKLLDILDLAVKLQSAIVANRKLIASLSRQ